MAQLEDKQSKNWVTRENAVIFADEDVDGLMSAVIVAKRYLKHFQIKFVTARSLTESLRRFIRAHKKNTVPGSNLDIYIVDVGVNQASIHELEDYSKEMTSLNMRVMFFDSHSNKFEGRSLLPGLKKAGVNIFLGRIGTAATSIIQTHLGTKETIRLQKLGALSDREINFSDMDAMFAEKKGLKMLQAAVAWGAWKEREFLHQISREIIYSVNLDFSTHKKVKEYAELAGKRRVQLYKHVINNAKVLELSANPRIVAVFSLDQIDFGKARGTIAGQLAGEWATVLLLFTKDSANNTYNISIRNHYKLNLDLEVLGQLIKVKSAGGSKGAYRITLQDEDLIPFLTATQEWAYTQKPVWFKRNAKRDS